MTPFARGRFLVHSFQPSFFSKTGSVSPGVLGGFLERRMPGKNGEGTPRTTKTNGEFTDLEPKKQTMGCSLKMMG